MADVKINDINLLRFCHETFGERNDEDFKESFPADKCVCFGEYRSDGEPLWVTALYNFRKSHDCEADIVINQKGLVTPSLFVRIAQVFFDYAFNQAKLERCTAKARISNTKSHRLLKAWGFREEGIRRRGYSHPPIEDMVLFGMIKDECRWIKRTA